MFSFTLREGGIVSIIHNKTDYNFQYTQSPTSNCQWGTLSCMGDFLELVENSGNVVPKMTKRQVPSLSKLFSELRKSKMYVQNMMLVDVQERYISCLCKHLEDCGLEIIFTKPYTSTNGSKMVLVMFKTH